MQYIHIANWEHHQHYKDRRPTWVKLEIEIIEEFDADGNPKKFRELPDLAKLTFMMLLCLRANYNDKIPYPNDSWLRKRLGLAKIDLKSLCSAGYINIDTDSVSKPYQPAPVCLPPETETEKEKEKETESSIHPKAEEGGHGFDDFWSAYPKKVGKGAAKKAWAKIKNPASLLPQILEAIKRQSQSEQWRKNNGQYIPNPATWLNQERWTDEITTSQGDNGGRPKPAPPKQCKQCHTRKGLIDDDSGLCVPCFRERNPERRNVADLLTGLQGPPIKPRERGPTRDSPTLSAEEESERIAKLKQQAQGGASHG